MNYQDLVAKLTCSYLKLLQLYSWKAYMISEVKNRKILCTTAVFTIYTRQKIICRVHAPLILQCAKCNSLVWCHLLRELNHCTCTHNMIFFYTGLGASVKHGYKRKQIIHDLYLFISYIFLTFDGYVILITCNIFPFIFIPFTF